MEKVGEPGMIPHRAGARKTLDINGRQVGLIRSRRDGKLICMDSICYHMGGPLVANGDLEDIGSRECLTCPWHQYKIDVRTGEGLYQDLDRSWRSKGVKQRTHVVEERSDGIYVQLNEDAPPVESDGYARKKSPQQ